MITKSNSKRSNDICICIWFAYSFIIIKQNYLKSSTLILVFRIILNKTINISL